MVEAIKSVSFAGNLKPKLKTGNICHLCFVISGLRAARNIDKATVSNNISYLNEVENLNECHRNR